MRLISFAAADRISLDEGILDLARGSTVLEEEREALRGEMRSFLEGGERAWRAAEGLLRLVEENLSANSFREILRREKTLYSKDEVEYPRHIRIRCYLNGQLMQDSTTENLIFDIP